MGCGSCLFLGVVGILTLLKLYIKYTTGWCKSHACLVGKTAIITGANTGIGYETALDFAKRGARVILACRSESKANEAKNKIIKETENENIAVKVVNMESFASVRQFAKEINETESRLDILVNNAGAVGIPDDKKTEDGNVIITQINYYSSFLLTNLLVGLLKKTGHSRIVNVSSSVASSAKLEKVSELDTFPGDLQVYHVSKLCQIFFTQELHARLRGTGVTVYSLHPGAIQTDILRHTPRFFQLPMQVVQYSFFKTVEEGAQTTIYVSVAKGIEDYSGDHFADCKRVEPYKTTLNPGLAKKLWEKSEEVCKIKPEELQF